jgi:thiol:disulfide interchange protein
MTGSRLLSALAAILLPALPGAAAGPFTVSGSERTDAAGNRILDVAFRIPAGHYLYAEQISARGADGKPLDAASLPAPHRKSDPFSGEEVGVYDSDTTLSYVAPPPTKDAGVLGEVSFQGCNDQICFLPETVRLLRAGPETTAPVTPTPAPDSAIEGFSVKRRASGFLPPSEFAAFLEGTEDGVKAPGARSPWIVLLLILGGGLMLNLTPCVLPMIPVNIAILGAGARGGSRTRGLLLGATYGLGICLAYGALGLIVVLTGAKFGSLNASPLFNLASAALFLFMALAMFGVFNVDLSRYQSRVGVAKPRKGGVTAAFILGSVSALLAGACVAPVLIWVLVLATDLHAGGRQIGLLLPFIICAGMALAVRRSGAFFPAETRPLDEHRQVHLRGDNCGNGHLVRGHGNQAPDQFGTRILLGGDPA